MLQSPFIRGKQTVLEMSTLTFDRKNGRQIEVLNILVWRDRNWTWFPLALTEADECSWNALAES